MRGNQVFVLFSLPVRMYGRNITLPQAAALAAASGLAK